MKILRATVACAACLAATTAFADEVTVNSVRLSYTRAQLRSPEGAKDLYAHIRAAARDVCLGDDLGDPWLHRRFKACVHNAVEKAVHDVSSSELAAVDQAARG